MSSPILYLDYDGVLHPSDVWLVDDKPFLQWPEDPSLTLFCWAPILESILDDHDPAGRIKIILSTTWGQKFGLQVASEYLSDSLKGRVIGKTSHSDRPRGVQIAQHARYHIKDQPWLAIDDDFGATTQHQEKLIKCHGSLGISSIKTQQELRIKLEVLLKRRYQ